jgi:hypothetical protein
MWLKKSASLNSSAISAALMLNYIGAGNAAASFLAPIAQHHIYPR